MKQLFPLLLLTVFAASAPGLDDEGLLPNPSFETSADGGPSGFRMSTTPPDTPGDFYITEGSEGDTTHSGRAALQFRFPEGAAIAQAVWTGSPRLGGLKIEPGRYNVSFWIRAEEMLHGFHTWVALTGFASDGRRIMEFARSDYLTSTDLPPSEWKNISFSMEITPELGIDQIAPSVIFKTSPSGSVNQVPPETRILVDDIVLTEGD